MGPHPPEWVVTHPTDQWREDPVSPEYLRDMGYTPAAQVFSYRIWRLTPRQGVNAPGGR